MQPFKYRWFDYWGGFVLRSALVVILAFLAFFATYKALYFIHIPLTIANNAAIGVTTVTILYASRNMLLSFAVPVVSKYFRLDRKPSKNHTYHLGKRYIPSISLFSGNSPQGAIELLAADLLNDALPTALDLVEPGSKIIVCTHLFRPDLDISAAHGIEGFTYSAFRQGWLYILLYQLSAYFFWVLRMARQKKICSPPYLITKQWYQLTCVKGTEVDKKDDQSIVSGNPD